jgi:type I restriction enzyme S subunit
MSSAATGVTRFGLRSDAISDLEIPMRALEEQRAIADYLDRETAQIDGLIAARQRMKLLLAERRDAELHLFADPHPDKATRPVPIRRLVRKEERRPTSAAVVTAFRDGRVMSSVRRRIDGFTESKAQAGYQGVEEGDIVFHGLDGFAGAIGVSEDRGACSPVYHVCSVRGPYDADYVALSLRALALSGYLALQSGNVRERAVDFRNWETLARVPIAVPPLQIQRARAQAYMERRDRTEKLQDCIERQVALLFEHRQALITSAVTGRIDIPVAA